MITFTELEVVLCLGLVVVLYINHKLISVISANARERARVLEALIGVAENRWTVRRTDEGVQFIKLEKTK